jgi:hypothetical protein
LFILMFSVELIDNTKKSVRQLHIHHVHLTESQTKIENRREKKTRRRRRKKNTEMVFNRV